MTSCEICAGTQWVCEDHRDTPQDTCCGGAGAPCPKCNPLAREEKHEIKTMADVLRRVQERANA